MKESLEINLKILGKKTKIVNSLIHYKLVYSINTVSETKVQPRVNLFLHRHS